VLRYVRYFVGDSLLKFRYLDGLRGLAALIVVTDHYIDMALPAALRGYGLRHHMGEGWLHNTPLHLVLNGAFAVTIFFVLSGIVLSAKFFRTKSEPVVAAGAAKRYVRLALPALGSVLLACLLLKLHLFYNHQSGAVAGSAFFWGSLWSFSPSWHQALYQGLYGAIFTQDNSYNLPLWTLQVELTGSFLVFMTLALFGKLRNRWVFYSALALVFLRSNLLAFLLGVFICDMYFNRRIVFDTLSRWYWLPLVLLSLVVGSQPIEGTSMFAFWNLQGWGDHVHVLVHTLAAALLIVNIIAARPLQRFLETRPVQFLGRISFSLYLLHFLVLGTYGSYLFMHLVSGIGYRWGTAIAYFPFLLISIIAAYIYAKYVDVPAISLSGAIYRRWFATVAPRRDAAKDGAMATSSGATVELPQPGIASQEPAPTDRLREVPS
jgi:peptidoglycan/LPS O-acetylase OafA/YrhL